jgi:hypothetical protein
MMGKKLEDDDDIVRWLDDAQQAFACFEVPDWLSWGGVYLLSSYKVKWERLEREKAKKRDEEQLAQTSSQIQKA